MKKAFFTDIFRSIKKDWKRFLSILIITALGVGIVTGLKASAIDIYYSSDRLYNSQNLFDIRILSTLGITNDDIKALSNLENVDIAEGGFVKTVHTNINSSLKKTDMTVLSQNGLNKPLVLSGNLPENSGEVAVSKKYLKESKKSVGDVIQIKDDIKKSDSKTDDKTDLFKSTSYKITGVVSDPKDISGEEAQGSNFRTSSSADYTFFITDKDVDMDTYTVAYIKLATTSKLNSYSKDYESEVKAAIGKIENSIQKQREQARYDSVLEEAKTRITDSENTMNQKFADAEKQIAEAKNKIEQSKKELADGKTKLAQEEANANKQFADARKEIEASKQKIPQSENEIKQGEMQLTEGEKQLNDAQIQINSARQQLEPAITQFKTVFGVLWPEKEWNSLVTKVASLSASGADDATIISTSVEESTALIQKINDSITIMKTQLGNQAGQLNSLSATDIEKTAIGLGKIDGNQQTLNTQKNNFAQQKEDTLQKLSNGREEIKKGKADLLSGEEKIKIEEANAKKKIDETKQKLKDGEKEITDGEAELAKQQTDFENQKSEAQQKISDGYAKLNDIDMTKWYVQDRSSLDSYSSLKNDLSSIEGVGKVFPVIFILVAVLMSLTTMTRMVEEERGIIGTYKALGFSNKSIYLKYVIFAIMACIAGGILGSVIGFVIFPKFIILILSSLYNIPQYYLQFNALYGFFSIFLFAAVIAGATLFVCEKELSQVPSVLLRPKAPQSGSRILLERIPFIWNRMKFLNKVTVRNLFRFKKRLLMTVCGIMGCTALIICGFAIKDSVLKMAPSQYKTIYQYDLMAVFEQNENDNMIHSFGNDNNIKDYVNLHTENIKLINSNGKSNTVQLMVIPKDKTLNSYINLKDPNNQLLDLNDNGIIITENAATILGIKNGEQIDLQNTDLVQKQATVSGVAKNYLGNNIYMTQKLYESLFNEYKANAVLAHLSDECANQKDYAESLLDKTAVLSSVSSEAMLDNFGFDLIDSIVIMFIVMAGGLAFVVLFTLSNTNISERERELATIKVLGFYDREVYQYVNKETLILTLIGILVGLPLGRVLSSVLISALNMPAIQFEIYIRPISYFISAAIPFIFALLVNLVTNKMLKRINMVEALKSVE